jgi:hypothetical protein
MKHVIEIWESGSRQCWSCNCGCGGSVNADGEAEIAAEKHLNPDDHAVYRYTVSGDGW